MDIHIDQTVLRAREVPRCSEVLKLAKARIKKKLQGKRGRKRQPRATPMSNKDAWTGETMENAANNATEKPYTTLTGAES